MVPTSVSVMTTDLYCAATLATGVLTCTLLAVELSTNQIAGLAFIVLALALVGITQEVLGVQDDDEGPCIIGTGYSCEYLVFEHSTLHVILEHCTSMVRSEGA